MVQIERDAITNALKTEGGNIGRAADRLGASRRTLQNRMREYGMPRGKAGHPRSVLPFKHGFLPSPRGTTDLLLLGAVGAGIFLASRWLRKPGQSGTTLVGGVEARAAYLRGVDALL